MINLLLPKDKKIISHEYRWRVMISYGLAFGLLLTISIIIVISFYGNLLTDQMGLKNTLATENKGVGGKEFDNSSTQIIRANKMISLLTGDRNNLHHVSNLLDRIIAAKPLGIKLKTIEVTRGDKNQWLLNLGGTAEQRNDVINFIATLKKDPLFMNIDSPFTNLIKSTNSEFTMVITLDSNSDLQKNGQN